MPNWGTPDYDVNEVIDYETLHAQILREYPKAILQWPYQVAAGASPRLVQKYCVDIAEPTVREWQKTRLRMKGKPTHLKLAILLEWYKKDFGSPNPCAEILQSTEVQVVNYLGALRRGGQLDENNRIRKYK